MDENEDGTMTQEEFNSLAPGDVVKHVLGGYDYIVTANYGDRVTAVRTIDMTNPSEWVLIIKAQP